MCCFVDFAVGFLHCWTGLPGLLSVPKSEKLLVLLAPPSASEVVCFARFVFHPKKGVAKK